MDPRQQQILQAILESFIKTAAPVGSRFIYETYLFGVSPATIRNEMMALEEEGYIAQPHTSAGRVPTSRAYRLMVDQLQPDQRLFTKVRQDLNRVRKEYMLQKTKEKLYEVVGILAAATQNVSFATLPEVERVFFVGVGNILKKPEFSADPVATTRVVETLEHRLYDVLCGIDIRPEGAVYIGEENLLPEFQSCSLLAIPYKHNGFRGALGILGPTRMDYAYNLAALKAAPEFIN